MSEPRDLPVLETERCLLRGLTPQDDEAMFAIFSDRETMRFWSSPPHLDIDQTRTRLARGIARVEAGSTLWWGIQRKGDDRLLGNISIFFDEAQRHHRAELGYVLGREYWGQGYMGEAQRAVVAYAFGTLGLHRLEADTDPRNQGSVRSLERLGFQHEGVLRDRWEVAGEVTDSLILGLLAKDWESGRVG
jgi:ribosomal-protein-alanine N-acetyltransferase